MLVTVPLLNQSQCYSNTTQPVTLLQYHYSTSHSVTVTLLNQSHCYINTTQPVTLLQ